MVAKEDQVWFLTRIDIESRKIFVVDFQPNIVLRSYFAVKILLRLMKELIPSNWSVSYCTNVPRYVGRKDSATLMCLNLASFAYRRPMTDDVSNRFKHVFAYKAEADFLRKSKYYIASVARKSLLGVRKIEAAFQVEDPDEI